MIKNLILCGILIICLSFSVSAKTHLLPRTFEMSPTALECFSKECNMEIINGTISFDPESITAQVIGSGIKDGVQWTVSGYWKNGYFMLITFTDPKRVESRN